MKKYEATFRTIIWYNGGKREGTRKEIIEARNINSAKNKASKMESYGSSRRWNLLESIEEVA